MKKIIIFISALIVFIAVVPFLSSCSKILNKNIELNNKEFQFEIIGGAKIDEEQVIYEGDMKMDLVPELKKQGFSEKNLKSFLIKKGKLVLVKPIGFDMKEFKGVKLYFGDKNLFVVTADEVKEVATADEVKENALYFNVDNPDLLSKLSQDKLHIILKGKKPTKNVEVKFVADYVANIGIL